jgi:hypothetical protein
MGTRLLLIIFLLFVCRAIYAQTPIDRSVELKTSASADTRLKLLDALDTLLLHINIKKIDSAEINPIGRSLSLSIFRDLKDIENNKQAKEGYYKPQLINLYPVNGSKYIISLAYVNAGTPGARIRMIFNFIAALDSNKVTFSIPVYYITHNWKTTKVGNITYHHPDNINIPRAKGFDKKNTEIALKLGLKPEQFDFYLCNNYQEIMHLLGYEYDNEYAGFVTDGYGVDAHTIFSTMHNEDFSHDTFHYYSGKFRKNARNSAADEGVAYSWGNAYYTDKNGEMITPKQLIPQLKQYLLEHPHISLLELFYKNPLIFTEQTKVRSLLSCIICDEVERQKGIAGIKELLNCGSGDNNFFMAVNKLTGLNTANFDEKVTKLVENYK